MLVVTICPEVFNENAAINVWGICFVYLAGTYFLRSIQDVEQMSSVQKPVDWCLWLVTIILIGDSLNHYHFLESPSNNQSNGTTEGVEHFSDDNSGRIDSGKQAQQWNMALFYNTFLFNHVIFHCPVK